MVITMMITKKIAIMMLRRGILPTLDSVEEEEEEEEDEEEEEGEE